MQRDFKIGMSLGLLLVVAAILWLCTRPSLSPEARMSEPQETAVQMEISVAPIPTQEVTEVANNQLSIIDNQPKSNDYTLYEQPERIATQRFHIVRRGETLSAISQKYYGSADKWRKIFQANRQIIDNADKIQPGTKLVIPD
jgi:nucleoid-associated protein YgaU